MQVQNVKDVMHNYLINQILLSAASDNICPYALKYLHYSCWLGQKSLAYRETNGIGSVSKCWLEMKGWIRHSK